MITSSEISKILYPAKTKIPQNLTAVRASIFLFFFLILWCNFSWSTPPDYILQEGEIPDSAAEIRGPLLFDNWANNQVFVSSDLISAANTTAPLKNILGTTGEYPFWNPYIFSGMPAYESLSFTRLTYLPGEIFVRIRNGLGLPWMFGLLTHIFMAGLFTFLFLKRRGLSQLVSIFGGLISSSSKTSS